MSDWIFNDMMLEVNLFLAVETQVSADFMIRPSTRFVTAFLSCLTNARARSFVNETGVPLPQDSGKSVGLAELVQMRTFGLDGSWQRVFRLHCCFSNDK